MTENGPSDHSATVVLRDALFRVGVTHWRPIAAAVAGFVLGAATLKIQLADALSTARDAKEVCTQVHEDIKQLATEREVQAVNKRLDDWFLYAGKVAEEPPNGKSKTTRK